MTTTTAPSDASVPVGSFAPALTKQDVAALRKAEEIDASLDRDGRHWLHCIKRRTPEERERDPFLEDQVYRIACEGGVIQYETAASSPLVAHTRVRARFGHDLSLERIVRVGDRLRLVWLRGNNCDALTDNGFSQDELHLEVVRGSDKDGRRPIQLPVDTRVLPSHSTARMIRQSLSG